MGLNMTFPCLLEALSVTGSYVSVGPDDIFTFVGLSEVYCW